MTPPENASVRELRARDELAGGLLQHPEVSMVDVGLDADGQTHVLRVHLRDEARHPPVPIPEEVDGIPVRIVGGDYTLE